MFCNEKKKKTPQGFECSELEEYGEGSRVAMAVTEMDHTAPVTGGNVPIPELSNDPTVPAYHPFLL